MDSSKERKIAKGEGIVNQISSQIWKEQLKQKCAGIKLSTLDTLAPLSDQCCIHYSTKKRDESYWKKIMVCDQRDWQHPQRNGK